MFFFFYQKPAVRLRVINIYHLSGQIKFHIFLLRVFNVGTPYIMVALLKNVSLCSECLSFFNVSTLFLTPVNIFTNCWAKNDIFPDYR